MRHSVAGAALLIALAGNAAGAEGGLSKDVIAKVVSRHQPEVKFCYERRLQEAPHLSGKLVVHWWIEADGRVVEASVEQSLDAQVDACVLGRVKRWTFPPPDAAGRVAITYPWIFKVADDAPERGEGEAASPLPPDPAEARRDAEARRERSEGAAAASPPPTDPDEERRSAEAFRREHEQYRREHPPGLAELWAQGGLGMYPIALGLFFGLGAGALGVVLALARLGRAAVLVGGLCLGGGAFAFSTGWLGYINGMTGAYQALSHAAAVERAIILEGIEDEASVCWKFGTLAALSCAVLGLGTFGLALRRKAVPHV